MIMAVGVAMAQKSFTFGPKIGVDYTHFWGENVEHGGMLNYQAGLFMEYRFTDKLSIAPEVVFAAQGGKYELDEGSGIVYKHSNHVNYINVPVMLKFYVCPAVSIDFGPQVGFNIYSKNISEYNDGGVVDKETKDIKNYTNSIDFGVGLGLTYNIAKEVFVQGRYTMGLTNTFKEAYSQHAKNGNAQIAIGYRF